MASVDNLAPGSLFAERYRIVSPLGEGEMGQAYVAESLLDGERCVLKVMAAAVTKRGEPANLFVHYATRTSKVASAHVLQTLAAGIDPSSGRTWFTTELLSGDDLATRVARDGPLTTANAGVLVAALGDALSKSHAQDLVHYDLTPENVHVGEGRQVVVRIRELTVSRLVSEALAAQGEIFGSAQWMAPEQFDLGERLTPKANVWSLALIAFYAAIGRAYWINATDDPMPSKDLLREILGGPLVPASQRARALGFTGSLPAWFDRWFDHCVKRDPTERVSSAEATKEFLADALDPQAATMVDAFDSQRTTNWEAERPSRTKGGRSLPRGILAEVRSHSTPGAMFAASETTPPTETPPATPTATAKSSPPAAAETTPPATPTAAAKSRPPAAAETTPPATPTAAAKSRPPAATETVRSSDLKAPGARPKQSRSPRPFLVLFGFSAVALGVWLSSHRSPWPFVTAPLAATPPSPSATASSSEANVSPRPSETSVESPAPSPPAVALSTAAAIVDANPPAAPVSVKTFAAGEAPGGASDFDLAAALRALNGAYYGNCAVHSAGKVAVTFAPNGHVKRVAVLRGDYDEATTSCIAARFSAAKMPPFRGTDQTVSAEIAALR